MFKKNEINQQSEPPSFIHLNHLSRNPGSAPADREEKRYGKQSGLCIKILIAVFNFFDWFEHIYSRKFLFVDVYRFYCCKLAKGKLYWMP